MKKLLLFSLCVFVLFQLKAQTTMEEQPVPTRFYLGLGSGVDNFTGFLGVSGTLRLAERFSIRGGVGLSGWGIKRSIGIKVDANEKRT